MNTKTEGTVVLGFGPQAIEWISKASKLCGKDAVMCPQTAQMAGANLAAGTPEALASLRQRLEAGALQAQKQETPGLSEAATRWLASGERGLSSETIFQHLTGISTRNVQWQDRHPHTPSDPADVRRCRLLLEQVPELAPMFPKMAEVSAAWKDLVYLWDDICKTMDQEAPQWRKGHGQPCPKTYELIKRAIGR